ncbi:unnamed protein product [Ectocarpus sp. CCAP 1310/34]|nr:unnamed protein product [Ectocarpus sp. CCAP 1310/34]
MLLGRVGTLLPSCGGRLATRRFLAKKAAGRGGGGKKGSGTPKKGPAAIKARGAMSVSKAGKQGSNTGKSGGAAAREAAATTTSTTKAAAAEAAESAKPPPVGGGGGFTKSEMLAARKARKASATAEKAAAAATAKAAAPAAAAGAGRAGGVGGAASAAGAGGAKGQGKWGWGTRLLAGTSVGLAAFGIAWQLKPDEMRKLLDDSPIDHFFIWFMGKWALVRGTLPCFSSSQKAFSYV